MSLQLQEYEAKVEIYLFDLFFLCWNLIILIMLNESGITNL